MPPNSTAPRPAPGPLAVRCCACLAPPGEPCIGTTSNLPREKPHRLRPLAAASRLVRCSSCAGGGWRETGREVAPTVTTCPVCDALPYALCTEGGHGRARVHEVRVRAAHAGLEECGACEAVGWVPEPAAPRPDVPDELIQMMADAEFDAPPGCSARDSYRTVLAAVVPVIERRVREQVAAEILTSKGPDQRFPSGWASHVDQEHAARIARGEAR